MNSTSVEVTAGLGGFLVVFGLGLVLWLLGRDMTRRMRRMRLREEERLLEEAQAQGRAESRPVDVQEAVARSQARRPVQTEASRLDRPTAAELRQGAILPTAAAPLDDEPDPVA